MTLPEIEHQHDFSYPSLYRQLEQDGMLNVGEYGPDWYNTVLPTLKDRPTLLLFADDFELLGVDAVAQALAEQAEPDDYRQIDPAFTFIPFAQTGAGDHYCFFPTGAADGEIPIVLLWHDEEEARYVAKNLQDFIFSMLLDSMADQDTYNDVSDEQFREQLGKNAGHARALSDAAPAGSAANAIGPRHRRLRGGLAQRQNRDASRLADRSGTENAEARTDSF